MEDDKLYCICCKEEISYANTRTKAGWCEVDISGMCEKCFDNATFCLGENVSVLDEEILEVVKNGVVLAGGALRSLVDYTDTICDYDLFFLDKTRVQSVRDYFLSKDYNLIFECPKGELFTYYSADTEIKVQIILKREYKDCYDLINSFDVRACCAAYDGNQFYTNEGFVFDNLNKLININKIEYPVATLRRIAKYSAKGFTLTSQASQYFVETVNQFELTEDNTALYID